ncbi:uncharacterized protein PHALS_14775 [Plasmopara halstedii]|uniref:Uncharacterized protein n=1 Tax=Plasmopara halstedii TaxID=4781 RepID=A0A0P1ARW9_PLAHL|nr:uncharacterized protein PHALS_14775 [Plasmopara halstedii]CEG44119.1 hypothetical protein PHALS_14775 [Plasmopara halstedii]|eukprot:XP_024580488.1 hypothetical protein PHALS_14775 [Plasmopara halstedii]
MSCFHKTLYNKFDAFFESATNNLLESRGPTRINFTNTRQYSIKFHKTVNIISFDVQPSVFSHPQPAHREAFSMVVCQSSARNVWTRS